MTYYRLHAIQRMFERRIPLKKVSLTLGAGETIEDYSSEMPQPGRLILGFQGKRPIHVVVSESSDTGGVTVITVYLPDPDRWDSKFRKRRS
jgi:hypothetical protein